MTTGMDDKEEEIEVEEAERNDRGGGPTTMIEKK